ncbi:MAG: glycosyltransferase, partial [Bacteroidota bacterium]
FLENPAASKSFDLVYVGSISLTRGIVETIAVLEKGPYRYLLLGDYRNQRTSDTIQALPAYATQVNYRPFTSSRQTIQTAIYEAKIGMANLQNVANFRVAYLIKIFEYMAAGLPVIATNFPLWQTIIEQHECGLTIPPDDPSALVAAIDHLLDNPEQATQMGQNGRRAVEKHYNWEQEEQKLLALYTQLLAE